VSCTKLLCCQKMQLGPWGIKRHLCWNNESIWIHGKACKYRWKLIYSSKEMHTFTPKMCYHLRFFSWFSSIENRENNTTSIWQNILVLFLMEFLFWKKQLNLDCRRGSFALAKVAHRMNYKYNNCKEFHSRRCEILQGMAWSKLTLAFQATPVKTSRHIV